MKGYDRRIGEFMKNIGTKTLETERLILRRFRKSDLEDMYEYLSNADVAKYMTMDEVEKMIDWRISTDEMIAVELKCNSKMTGNVYLGKEIMKHLKWAMYSI